jgi:hypothetical protein
MLVHPGVARSGSYSGVLLSRLLIFICYLSLSDRVILVPVFAEYNCVEAGGIASIVSFCLLPVGERYYYSSEIGHKVGNIFSPCPSRAVSSFHLIFGGTFILSYSRVTVSQLPRLVRPIVAGLDGW